MHALNVEYVGGGDIVYTMRRMATHDRNKLAELGVKSPDLSRCNRKRVDNQTIVFKSRCLIRQNKHNQRTDIMFESIEPIFDD